MDNFDSFVYNLVQYLGELGAETVVWRNNDYDASEVLSKIEELKPSHILISPGSENDTFFRGQRDNNVLCLSLNVHFPDDKCFNKFKYILRICHTKIK